MSCPYRFRKENEPMPQTNLSMMFKLFSVAFEPPTIPLVEAVVSGALRADIKTMAESLELPQDAIATFCEGLEAYIGCQSEEALPELRREYTRLFLGDKPIIANSEGLYRMKAEGRQAVLMVNTYSLEVAEFMRECGVIKAKGYNDCIDYLENECNFASILAEQPEYLIELGKDPLSLLEFFIDNHLLLWVPGFCRDVVSSTKVAYYQELSRLMGAFMKEFERSEQ